MKIAMLTKHFNFRNGSSRVIHEISTRLAAHGHEVHIFCNKRPASYAAGPFLEMGVTDRFVFLPFDDRIEELHAGADGLIFPDGLVLKHSEDIEGIASALEDPAMRERMGRAARVTSERYTWDAAAEKTMQAYEEIIRERDGSCSNRGV
ncbi:MAG: hypothetical protein AABY46_05180 [Nitrospirota bacterium]